MSLETIPNTWFYRSARGHMGPVHLEELRKLVKDGMLDLNGEVRADSSGTWRRIDAVEGLTAEPEELHDLSELDFHFEDENLSDGETATQPENRPDPDFENDLVPPPVNSANTARHAFQVPTGHGSPEGRSAPRSGSATVLTRPPTEPHHESRQQPAESRGARVASGPESRRWFCSIKGVEYGPLKRWELENMARQGRLQPGAKVRRGDQPDWVTAGEIAGLFEHVPPARETSARPRQKRAGAFDFRRRKTLLLQLALLGTALTIAYAVVNRARDIPNEDIYYRTELIFTRHINLKRSGDSKSEREKLVREAEELRNQILPVLNRTASSLRKDRQVLLVAVRDHLLPMLQTEKAWADQHEREFIEKLRAAKRLWLDPGQKWHVEPDTGTPPEKPGARSKR